jgi:predicted nucleic acid-binding protein
MIGFDTSALIDFFKSDSSLKKVFDNLDGVFCINDIVYLEFMIGLDDMNKKHSKEEDDLDELIQKLEVYHLDKKSIKLARNIIWDMKRKGNLIGSFDGVIAGIYLSNGVDKIITKNKKHFEGIKGLKVISY